MPAAGTAAGGPATGAESRRTSRRRPLRSCYPPVVITRAADPRTTDRIVYDLVRSASGQEGGDVIGTATFAAGSIELSTEPDVEAAIRELLARPFVDRVQADERPRGYRRSRQGQVDLLVPGMAEHFIARMRGLWLSYADGAVVTAREVTFPEEPSSGIVLAEAVESVPAVVDPSIRRTTLAASEETVGRPLVRAHPPLSGQRESGVASHRTDCGWLT